MTWRFWVLFCLLLGACGRPLQDTERAFAQSLYGDQLKLERVRLVDGAPVGSITYKREPRPRVACRERILPPAKPGLVTVKPAAVALFNHVYFTKDWYTDNYMRDYPDAQHLIASMLLAHELVHVWQWQNRARTGYHPLRAAAEHRGTNDPYLFDLDEAPDFLSFGYEQQGAIVEEYVCCRALAPDAPRTQRLHDMLAAAFPVSSLPQSGRERDVILPWKDAELKGICD